LAGDARKAPRKQAAELQAQAEGVPAGDKLEFMGKLFRLSDTAGVMPLLKYSAYAESPSMLGPAAGALYAMLKDTIHEEEWDEFERHAMEQKARMDDLQDVIVKCVELLTARPTGSPSGSASRPSGPSGS